MALHVALAATGCADAVRSGADAATTDLPPSPDTPSDLPSDIVADAPRDTSAADAIDIVDASSGEAPDAAPDAPDAPDAHDAPDAPDAPDAHDAPDAPVSPPYAVDLPVDGPAAGWQAFPAVAVGGGMRLVVWCDARRPGGRGDIYAARVTPDGVVLDTRGLVIDASPGAHSAPKVAWDGTRFLVAWVDPGGVRAARVDTSGHLLDAAPLVVVDDPEVEAPLAIVFDGANHVIAWGNGGGQSGLGDVYAARVSPAGRLLDAPPIALDASPGRQADPALAWDGTRFVAAWTTPGTELANQLVAARLDRDLRPVGGRSDVAHAFFGRLSGAVASYDGSGFQLAWHDQEEMFNLVGTGRMLGDGAVTSSAASLGGGRSEVEGPALACDLTGRCLVTWTRDPDPPVPYGLHRHQYVAALQDGVLVGVEHPGPVFEGDTLDVALAWEGPRFATAWSGGIDNNWPDVFLATLAVDGIAVAGSRTLVSLAANSETRPAAATNGANHLVVWFDERNPAGTRLFGARVTHDGAMLDPAGIALSSATTLRHLDGPALASNGTDYLAVWSTDDPAGGPGWRVLAARVSGAGRLLDASPIVVARSTGRQLTPAVASDGAGWFVTWRHDGGTSDGFADVRGARVSGAGVVLDADSVPVSAAPGNQLMPVMAYDGAHYLVAWSDERTGLPRPAVWGGRFDRAGHALDGDGVSLYTTPDAVGTEPMGMSFDGTNFLVVWLDSLGLLGPSRIMAARVGSDASVVGAPIVVQRGSIERGVRQAAVFDGSRHALAWMQSESVGTSVRLGWLTPAGAVLPTSGVTALVDRGIGGATLSADRAGHTLLIDSRQNGAAEIAWSPRVEARSVRPGG
jgi:hypothetical protein